MSNEVVRWEPFNEMVSLRDAVNRLFDDSFIRPSAWPLPFDGDAWNMPVDMLETKDHIEVKASVPGLKPEDIQLEVDSAAISISGKRVRSSQGERWLRVERPSGDFVRQIPLPSDTTGDVLGSFCDGVLEIRIPKVRDETKPHRARVVDHEPEEITP